MPQSNFATFMIICPTSFFLGLVFSLFPYDYPLLWSTAPLAATHLDQLEAHLKLLHNAPNIIVRILHIVGGIGLLGLLAKLYKPTESNMLFDGGSLVLYMIALIVYLANIVKGLRMVNIGTYGEGIENMTQDRLDEIDLSTGTEVETGNEILGREDNLRVLSASNTILALVLVGVLVLQFGQWYAERAEAKERIEIAKRAKEREREKANEKEGAVVAETNTATTPVSASTPSHKKEGKGKGSKKTN